MNVRSNISTNTAARGAEPRTSAIYLARLEPPPASILDFLSDRFPHVGRDAWRRRMLDGKVVRPDGDAILPDAPYTAGITIHYFREHASEPIIPFDEHIIFRNEHLLIADKPHFLPVVPSGPYVDECLVARLSRRIESEVLTPVHRLDRETAGLVMFATDRATRPLYHRLFADRAIAKEYLAVCRGSGDIGSEYTVTGRIEPGEPWFRMKMTDGEANAVTNVRVIGSMGGHVMVHVRPETGKKHQIRLHLTSLGLPIVNDRLYPDVHPQAPYDFSSPLQLLAHRLAFTDPVSGRPMEFTSTYALETNGREGSMSFTAVPTAAEPETRPAS